MMLGLRGGVRNLLNDIIGIGENVIGIRTFSSIMDANQGRKKDRVKKIQMFELTKQKRFDEYFKNAPTMPYNKKTFSALNFDKFPFYIEREWWKRGCRMTFWPHWRALRSVGIREKIVATAAGRLRLKALKENTILPQAIRDEAAEKLSQMPISTHPKRVVNECLITGSRRGKLKRFRLKRQEFRRFAEYGKISGLIRALW